MLNIKAVILDPIEPHGTFFSRTHNTLNPIPSTQTLNRAGAYLWPKTPTFLRDSM